MPLLKQYQIFISHSWKNEEYKRLINLLDNARNLKYFDYSVSKEDPLPVRTTLGLHNGLRNQIQHANIVIVFAGMYINHSPAILDEISIALEYKKPIIAVVPWGNSVVPDIIRRCANEIVNWNTDSVVEAIRRNAN